MAYHLDRVSPNIIYVDKHLKPDGSSASISRLRCTCEQESEQRHRKCIEIFCIHVIISTCFGRQHLGYTNPNRLIHDICRRPSSREYLLEVKADIRVLALHHSRWDHLHRRMLSRSIVKRSVIQNSFFILHVRNIAMRSEIPKVHSEFLKP